MNEGINWTIRTTEQLGYLMTHINALRLPFSVKVGRVHTPKTWSQIKYAHSLCNAWAVHKKIPEPKAKRDLKAEFGVVLVETSSVTGDRSARLLSFADYSDLQMSAFLSATEVFFDENGVEYIRSEDE